MEPQAPSGTFLKVRGQEAKRQFLLWQTPSLPGGFKLGRQDTMALYPSLLTTFGELGATVRRHCCSFRTLGMDAVTCQTALSCHEAPYCR